MPIVVKSIAQARELEGQELGASDWMMIDQERINRFAEATDDFQWIHVDTERAAQEMPSGSTIAHGYLLTSLFPVLADQIVIFEADRAINYGLNKVRFKQMVPAGSRVRMRGILKSARKRAGALQIIMECRLEIEGVSKPACIAETIALYFVKE